MTPLTITIFLLISITQSQICTQDTDCESDEICSTTKICYGAFNRTDFDNITATKGYYNTPIDTTSASNVDVSTLLDFNKSTGHYFEFEENTDGDIAFYYISFFCPGERGFWIHQIDVIADEEPDNLAVFLPGATDLDRFFDEVAIGDLEYFTLTPVSRDYPFFAKNLTFRIKANRDSTVYEIHIYGIEDSPQPTSDPTEMPTEESMAPTTAPTPAPSDSPTPAPTGYPTPDVCEEYVIKQPCCGNYNFTKQEDKINLRDASLTTCNYTFNASCCGTVGGWVYAVAGDAFYGCENQLNKDTICRPSNFNTSINMTDDIYGTVITARDNNWEEFLTTTSLSVDALNANPDYCTCTYTTDECVGEDIAICGSPQDYERLFAEDCWMNETWTDEDDFTNESCWKETVANDPFYEHLLWEPCSIDSFLGNVTSVDMISSEIILDNTCTCQYAIRDCRVLEDRQSGQCNFKQDCKNDGECFEELANPCCSTGFDYFYKNYTGVTPTIDEMTGLPIDDGWTCNNNVTEICPDIYNGTRKYETEYRVDWWYDMEQDEIISRCGCTYTTDECNLPTTDPTQDPTSDPTPDPTPEPTDVADHALLITISPAASLILAIIAAFVL